MYPANGTRARLIYRPRGLFKLGMFDHEMAVSGEEPPIASVPRGHHTIKHVDAPGDTFNQVLRSANTHEVSGLLCGQTRLQFLNNVIHECIGFADREASHGVAGKADRNQTIDALLSQVRIDPALHNSEQGLAF